MSRSLWKNVYVDSVLLYQVIKGSNLDTFQTNSRASTILKEFVGKTFSVYNGKQYFVLPITILMVGYKFGEFVHTKKVCVYRKTKKVSKKYIKK
jgi:small subunit ribosomal protein S19